MINTVISDQFEDQFPWHILEETAKSVLKHQEISPDASLSIVVETNEELQKLNQQFRGIDTPTDVLSFPAGDVDPDTGSQYLGDIVISWEKVQTQAIHQSVKCEMRLMVVHGVLHLLGYDHHTDSEQAEMWAIQDAILQHYGCASPPIS